MISKCNKQGQRFSCQREVCKHLHTQRFTKAAVIHFVRCRLVRWRLNGLPARVTTWATRNLSVITKRCKTCVASAYLRTILNGWCTARRFRSMPGKKGMGSCLFGCGRGVDSIEHYAHCAILRAARETNVTINTIPCGIDGFLMLHCRVEEHVVIEHARYIYAFYM